MSLYQGFFYPGIEFQLLDHDTIGFIGGSSLCMWNLANGTKQYIVSQRKGFQCFASNHKKNIIALAEYGLKPAIMIYQYPRQNQFKIEGISTLEIINMQISLDGKYLIIVNGVPDYSIVVYDIEKRELLQGQDSVLSLNITTQNQLLDIKFNPSNSNEFCILFSKELIFYKILSNFVVDGQNIVQQSRIVKNNKLTSQDLRLILWDERNNIYAATETRIDYIDVAAMQIKQSIQLNRKLKSIVLTQKHVIAFYINGKIEWLNKYYAELVEDDQNLRPFYLDHTYKAPDLIKYAAYNHQMNKIIIGHSDGKLTVLKCEAERNSLDQQDEQKNQVENKQKANKSKQLILECISYGPHHTRPITMLKQLSTAPILVSAGMDGKIIFWSVSQKNIISYIDTDNNFTCGDINKDENLLVLGNPNGTISFYDISRIEKIRLIHEIKIFMKQPISQIFFNPSSDQIAITSFSSKLVYFVLTNMALKFQVLGYIILPYEIAGIAWNTSGKALLQSQSAQLYVLMNFLVVAVNPPESKNHNKRGNALRIQPEFYARKLDPDQRSLLVLSTGQIVTTGKDKILRKYKQPEELLSKLDLKVKYATNPPLQQLDGHDSTTTKLGYSPKQSILVSGSKDGSVYCRASENLSQFKAKIKAHNLKTNGVSAVLASSFNKIIYTAGYDGSLFIWFLDKINFNAGYAKKQNYSISMPDIVSQGQKLDHYDIILERQYTQSIKQQVLEKKRIQIAKIQNLKTELEHLLQQNQNHNPLEQLDRDQFCIDVDAKNKILEKGRQKCNQMREESKNLNLKNQIIARRIKERTWDRMSIQLKAINGLKTNILVYNYQIRSRTIEEERKINLILEMRRQNLKQVKLRKQRNIKQIIDVEFYKNKSIVTGGFPTVLVYNDYEKVEQKKEEKGKKKKDEELQQTAVAKKQEVQTDEEWGLFYCSFELFSNNAKRNQIIMIKNIIFKIKTLFNKQFDKLMAYRQSQNEIINEKNKRIMQIYQELKRNIETIAYKKNILENPDRILNVYASEINFQRYLSKEERDKIQERRLAQEERLRILSQDDAAQRALGKMMGGTLEQKKESALEVVIEREKWMDKPVQEMSEDEKMKMKEYQVKKQKAQQQKQRTIKKLEAELRKLKSEIEDIIDKFDEKLFILFRRKLQYDYRIEQQELYASKLAISILSVNQSIKKLKTINADEELRNKRRDKLVQDIAEIKNYAAQIGKTKQAKKASQQVKRASDIESRVKNIEKNVFEALQTDPKKRRQLELKWIEKDKSLENQLINLDPFLEIESRNLFEKKQKQFSTFIDEIKVIQQNYQGGEQTLLNVLQNRFNLRKQEAQLDKRLKNINNFVQELETELAQLENVKSSAENDILQLNQFLESSKSNIEIQFRLKQAYIQIPRESSIPQLSEALLLARNVIQTRNAVIIQSANEKINVMEKIKTCKISVTEETLNLQKKQSHANELQTKIKQVQMLKVKKEMQAALAKKDMKMNQTEIKNLQDQIQNIKKETQKRIGVYDKKIQKIHTDIEFIKKQNDQLEVQKWNLENTVKQRLKIQQMKNGEDGLNTKQSKEKFEQISVNRKLFDKAKKQTEQIQLLREQLSKLKAKTFANFSNIQR